MKIKHHFIIAAFLAVAMLGFGSAASAQTTDIEAMIAQLKAKIQELTL